MLHGNTDDALGYAEEFKDLLSRGKGGECQILASVLREIGDFSFVGIFSSKSKLLKISNA